MTYASELLKDKYAQIALNLPQKYNLRGARLHECAYYLSSIDKEHKHDHLIQLATKWAKK